MNAQYPKTAHTYNIRIGNSWADVHFVSFLFVIRKQFRAENSLLSDRIKISTFCSFTGQTFRQKVINCPAIANAWPLPAMKKHPYIYDK